jgi:hypothetical protein
MSEEGDVKEIPEEIIKEARQTGWTPLDKFKGKAENWVDADEWVERGKTLIPILTANNRRLQQDLLTRDQKIGTLEAKLESATAAIEKLEKHWSEANKRAVQNAKAQLRQELREARAAGDMEAEDKILDQLDEIRDAEREASKKPEAPPVKKDEPSGKDNQFTPSYKAWLADNPWYGVDKKKTKEYNRLSEDLREEGFTEVDGEFFDLLDREYAKRYGKDPDDDGDDTPPARPASKVESGSGRSGQRGDRGDFASLPKEARDACHADAEELVGPDKRYKTMKDWEAAYNKIYRSAE